MDINLDQIIAVIDAHQHHEWVADDLPIPCITSIGFGLHTNFLESHEGRATFLANLEEKRRMLQAQYANTGLCVCYLEVSVETGMFDGRKELVFLITIYSLAKAKPHLQHLARCQLARRATERALRHQGLVHRNVIPLIGQCVWNTRRLDEWKKK
jgi:hypothetical protein